MPDVGLNETIVTKFGSTVTPFFNTVPIDRMQSLQSAVSIGAVKLMIEMTVGLDPFDRFGPRFNITDLVPTVFDGCMERFRELDCFFVQGWSPTMTVTGGIIHSFPQLWRQATFITSRELEDEDGNPTFSYIAFIVKMKQFTTLQLSYELNSFEEEPFSPMLSDIVVEGIRMCMSYARDQRITSASTHVIDIGTRGDDTIPH